MSQHHIPFRTTATACLLAIALLVGAVAADAKTLYSPVLPIGPTDYFVCMMTNLHLSSTATVTFQILDFDTYQTVDEGLVTLRPFEQEWRWVPGMGSYICRVTPKGGSVRTQVGIYTIDDRLIEVQSAE